MARPYLSFTDEQLETMFDMYLAGHSLNSIRDALGIKSHMTVKNVLIRANLYKSGGYGTKIFICEACKQSFVAAGPRKFCETCIPDRTALQRYRLYNITQPQFNAMLEKQNGLCDLCEKPLDDDLKLDHCHEQGHNRGIIHHRCNIGLSYVEDREFVGMAVRYVEKHRR